MKKTLIFMVVVLVALLIIYIGNNRHSYSETIDINIKLDSNDYANISDVEIKGRKNTIVYNKSKMPLYINVETDGNLIVSEMLIPAESNYSIEDSYEYESISIFGRAEDGINEYDLEIGFDYGF